MFPDPSACFEVAERMMLLAMILALTPSAYAIIQVILDWVMR